MSGRAQRQARHRAEKEKDREGVRVRERVEKVANSQGKLNEAWAPEADSAMSRRWLHCAQRVLTSTHRACPAEQETRRQTDRQTEAQTDRETDIISSTLTNSSPLTAWAVVNQNQSAYSVLAVVRHWHMIFQLAPSSIFHLPFFVSCLPGFNGKSFNSLSSCICIPNCCLS